MLRSCHETNAFAFSICLTFRTSRHLSKHGPIRLDHSQSSRTTHEYKAILFDNLPDHRPVFNDGIWAI